MAVSPVQSRSLYKTFRSGKGTGGAADGSRWIVTLQLNLQVPSAKETTAHVSSPQRAPSETSLNNRVAAKTNIGNTNGNVGRRKILPGTSLGNRGAAACTIGSGGTCRTTS
ncbi:hypothetical protein Bbelb_420780 [Branchiostoma belcheri]|nr:hypothetical protein Bbelb_441690 [Branchiostoma belcheri]KAI8480159.1 hypothetical protein Bbelb_420780 [Branchiostoma belcheri]